MTIKTIFDGQKILLPKELAGHAPCEVEITVVDSQLVPGNGSIWDVVARSPGKTNAQDLIEEISHDRDLWEKN